MAPMTRCFSPEGVPGPDVAAYYGRRAEGGVGLIFTEGVEIPHAAAVDYPDAPHMHGDAALAGWQRVVEAVHAQDTKIFPQLWHQGVMWNVEYGKLENPVQQAMRPSGVWGPADGTISIPEEARARSLVETRPMTEEEIQDIIAAYAQAAANAKSIGMDGIAIHGAHGYLIDNFLWAYTNRRTDSWGGSRRGRARFGAEVVKAIRNAVGEEMPIALRFSQFKMQDYRARLAETPDELGELLGPLADAGVDLFDASQRYFDTPIFPGSELNLAGWAKKLTGKAAMTVGGIGLDKAKGPAKHIDDSQASTNNLPRVIERFERGEFDLICVGRSLLNDPNWLRKAQAGEAFLPFDPENLTRLT
jgi:2,4-dienoyl-CoA reductase-like NADH-dependent reductase (Old Yellow Enzyme family)